MHQVPMYNIKKQNYFLAQQNSSSLYSYVYVNVLKIECAENECFKEAYYSFHGLHFIWINLAEN